MGILSVISYGVVKNIGKIAFDEGYSLMKVLEDTIFYSDIIMTRIKHAIAPYA